MRNTMGRFQRFVLGVLAVIGILSIILTVAVAEYKEKNPYGSDVDILARNIYFEARGSSVEDQIAVGLTVLNRVHSDKYPNTIAEVVYQPRQYSWTLEYGLPANNETYRKIRALAKMIIENYEVLKRDDVCMHYTNNDDYGPNHWTKKFKKKTKIGKHWFYC